jgi:hypothetical protein
VKYLEQILTNDNGDKIELSLPASSIPISKINSISSFRFRYKIIYRNKSIQDETELEILIGSKLLTKVKSSKTKQLFYSLSSNKNKYHKYIQSILKDIKLFLTSYNCTYEIECINRKWVNFIGS